MFNINEHEKLIHININDFLPLANAKTANVKVIKINNVYYLKVLEKEYYITSQENVVNFVRTLILIKENFFKNKHFYSEIGFWIKFFKKSLANEKIESIINRIMEKDLAD